jgi:hypothetical protein
VTHDKLLANIGNPIDEGYQYGDIIYNKALRAVVELHKPDGSFCGECSHDTEILETYPCPTIQAIEKELG